MEYQNSSTSIVLYGVSGHVDGENYSETVQKCIDILGKTLGVIGDVQDAMSFSPGAYFVLLNDVLEAIFGTMSPKEPTLAEIYEQVNKILALEEASIRATMTAAF